MQPFDPRSISLNDRPYRSWMRNRRVVQILETNVEALVQQCNQWSVFWRATFVHNDMNYTIKNVIVMWSTNDPSTAYIDWDFGLIYTNAVEWMRPKIIVNGKSIYITEADKRVVEVFALDITRRYGSVKTSDTFKFKRNAERDMERFDKRRMERKIEMQNEYD